MHCIHIRSMYVHKFYLLISDTAEMALCILVMVNIGEMAATPLPLSLTCTALMHYVRHGMYHTLYAVVPSNSNSAVGNCLVPNLSFNRCM